MQLRDLMDAMESLAPLRFAEPWDNVGLLAGDPAQTLSRVMLTVDYTAEVAREVERTGCDAVVAYHPPLFDGLKRVTAGNGVFDAIRRGVALYAPHTALDVAEGGTNDVLADALGLVTRAPLRGVAETASEYKLVTFVPEAQVDRVADALFDAGAGRIGSYRACSFRTAGTGTFFGDEGTHPAVGAKGRLERVVEVRLETVVPIARAAQVVAALRAAHPYERPAFDLVVLAPVPGGAGIGRVGSFADATLRTEVIASVRRALGLSHVLVAGPTAGTVRRAAVCAGAGGDLLDAAIEHGAELYLTGELRHHDALRAARHGLTVVCTLHSNSERAALARLQSRLSASLAGVGILCSTVDRDPFTVD